MAIEPGKAQNKDAAGEGEYERRLREVNDALLVSLVRQQELTDKAEKAEAKARENEQRYRELFNSMDEGYCIIEMIFDEHEEAVDYRFLKVNPAFDKQSGMHDVTGKRMLEFVPSIEGPWLANYGKVALTGEPMRFAGDYPSLGRWFDVYAFRVGRPESRRVAVLFTDITERRSGEGASAYLAAIVNSSDDAIISKDLNGVITSWNKGAEHLFGYSAAEIIGKPVTMLIPEDHINEEPRILELIRRGKAIDHYETVRRRKDGTLIDVSLTVSPLTEMFEGRERIIGASKIAREITERKRAEEQLRRNAETFSKLVDQSPFGIYTVDSEFRISQVSEGAQPVFQNVRPLIGRDFGEAIRIVWSEPFASNVIDIFRHTLETGEPYLAPSLTEQRHDIETVESYEWQAHRVTLPDGHYGVACYFFDATQLREAEAQLRQFAADMSEADSRKNEFLAMLAHELRNPLAPIRNALQIMKIAGDGGPRLQAASEMMERQVGQLVRLLDDLLDVSRITRGKIELRQKRVELASIISQAVEAAKPFCEKNGVNLYVAEPPQPIYIYGDSARLNQIIGNLLNNACKFTDDGGCINLFVELEGEQAVIRIADTGIGIEPKQLGSIFDLFVQADTSLERTVSGLGIGLTLVNNLVEMHHGTVEARSDGLGLGSEFVVRLPVMDGLKPRSHTASEHADGEKAKVISRRILVVDDNVDSAESLAMLLQITGHEVRLAHDGREAVESAAAFLPEVVLMDIGLPRLNGYEAAREIRLQDWGKNMLLIAVTGWGQKEDRERSKNAGFDSHLVKPVDHTELLRKLEELA